MRRITRITLSIALLGSLLPAAAAHAHAGSPDMESLVRSVTPKTKGVTIQVLNGDDRFELENFSSKPVVVYGYTDEQYARLLPDGTVQVNRNSPAYYLNQDRLGEVSAPKGLNAKTPPRWTTVDKTHRLQWHDHRMHFMGKGVPSQVEDTAKRQKVFDYSIPIRVGDRRGAIAGTLWWKGETGGGVPVGAIAGFVVLLLVSAVAVIVVRRRRAAPREAREAEAW